MGQEAGSEKGLRMRGELRDALQKALLKDRPRFCAKHQHFSPWCSRCSTAACVFFWSFAIATGLVIAAMLVNNFWK